MAAGQGGERPPLAGKTTKKVAFTLLAGLLGCLVILGGLEAYLRIGVRHAGGVQGKELWRTSLVRIADDPEIGFENIPCPECNCPINSMGFRGPEYPPLPEPGVTRIAVLGDSVTYGWYVRCESIYPVVLERALNEIAPEGERFEVINAATSAYNVSYIEASYRLKVRKYHPSIVLYGFFPNDLDKLHVHQAEGNPPAVVLVRPEYFDAPETAWIPARGRALLERRSYVYNWLSARAWARAVARGEVGRKAGRLDERKTQIEALERLRREVEKDGAGFAMALIPPAIIRSDDPAFCRSGKLPPEQVPRCEETHLIFALAREAARREGIRLIEVLGAYSTHLDSDLRMSESDWDHPSALGHALIARSILERLDGLVDPRTARGAASLAAALTVDRLESAEEGGRRPPPAPETPDHL